MAHFMYVIHYSMMHLDKRSQSHEAFGQGYTVLPGGSLLNYVMEWVRSV